MVNIHVYTTYKNGDDWGMVYYYNHKFVDMFCSIVWSLHFLNVLLKPLLSWEIDQKTRGENRDSTWYAHTVGTRLCIHLYVIIIIYCSCFCWCVCVCSVASTDMDEDSDATRNHGFVAPLSWNLVMASQTFVIHDGWSEMVSTNNVAHTPNHKLSTVQTCG